MEEQTITIGSGVDYPTLEIDGKTYTVKFSRAALYRLDKAGFDLRTLPDELRQWFPHKDEAGREIPGRARLSVVIDILHAAISKEFHGTPEDLAEVTDPERTAEIVSALVLAMSKMQPPTKRAPAAAAQTGEQVQ